MTGQAVQNGKTTGLLLSGGIDSTVLLHQLLLSGRYIQPFYVRCGHAWESQELSAVDSLLRHFRGPALRDLVVMELAMGDVYGSHWSFDGQHVPDALSADQAVFLPGRNALLILKPALWCQLRGIRELALAPLGSSPFADASANFLERYQAVLSASAGAPIRLTYPFSQTTKAQVMQMGANLPLHTTFSCIAPHCQLHCGACNKCAERQRAFREAGRTDPTSYAPVRLQLAER